MNNVSDQVDVDFEPEDELGTVGAAKAKMQKLRDELEKVKVERQEYLDGWQRCKADSVNSRKDLLASAERQGIRAKESLIEDIIPTLDGFDMAAGSPTWESVDAGWRNGIDQIRNQLLDALSRHGVERFGKVGEKFDPTLHEIIQETNEMPGEQDSIIRILRFGYKLNGRVIRPAQVIVKK